MASMAPATTSTSTTAPPAFSLLRLNHDQDSLLNQLTDQHWDFLRARVTLFRDFNEAISIRSTSGLRRAGEREDVHVTTFAGATTRAFLDRFVGELGVEDPGWGDLAGEWFTALTAFVTNALTCDAEPGPRNLETLTPNSKEPGSTLPNSRLYQNLAYLDQQQIDFLAYQLARYLSDQQPIFVLRGVTTEVTEAEQRRRVSFAELISASFVSRFFSENQPEKWQQAIKNWFLSVTKPEEQQDNLCNETATTPTAEAQSPARFALEHYVFIQNRFFHYRLEFLEVIRRTFFDQTAEYIECFSQVVTREFRRHISSESASRWHEDLSFWFKVVYIVVARWFALASEEIISSESGQGRFESFRQTRVSPLCPSERVEQSQIPLPRVNGSAVAPTQAGPEKTEGLCSADSREAPALVTDLLLDPKSSIAQLASAIYLTFPSAGLARPFRLAALCLFNAVALGLIKRLTTDEILDKFFASLSALYAPPYLSHAGGVSETISINALNAARRSVAYECLKLWDLTKHQGGVRCVQRYPPFALDLSPSQTLVTWACLMGAAITAGHLSLDLVLQPNGATFGDKVEAPLHAILHFKAEECCVFGARLLFALITVRTQRGESGIRSRYLTMCERYLERCSKLAPPLRKLTDPWFSKENLPCIFPVANLPLESTFSTKEILHDLVNPPSGITVVVGSNADPPSEPGDVSRGPSHEPPRVMDVVLPRAESSDDLGDPGCNVAESERHSLRGNTSYTQEENTTADANSSPLLPSPVYHSVTSLDQVPESVMSAALGSASSSKVNDERIRLPIPPPADFAETQLPLQTSPPPSSFFVLPPRKLTSPVLSRFEWNELDILVDNDGGIHRERRTGERALEDGVQYPALQRPTTPSPSQTILNRLHRTPLAHPSELGHDTGLRQVPRVFSSPSLASPVAQSRKRSRSSCFARSPELPSSAERERGCKRIKTAHLEETTTADPQVVIRSSAVGLGLDLGAEVVGFTVPTSCGTRSPPDNLESAFHVDDSHGLGIVGGTQLTLPPDLTLGASEAVLVCNSDLQSVAVVEPIQTAHFFSASEKDGHDDTSSSSVASKLSRLTTPESSPGDDSPQGSPLFSVSPPAEDADLPQSPASSILSELTDLEDEEDPPPKPKPFNGVQLQYVFGHGPNARFCRLCFALDPPEDDAGDMLPQGKYLFPVDICQGDQEQHIRLQHATSVEILHGLDSAKLERRIDGVKMCQPIF